MSSEAIQYFDRHSGSVQTEKVYGDGFLRWTYGNPLGRLALHALVKRSLFSRWYGWRMDSPRSMKKGATGIGSTQAGRTAKVVS